jgi:GDPmannose 4,6-dehydratase
MRVLITGVTGQDGSYLAEFLLEKGYEVYGVVRRSSSLNRQRIEHLTNYGAGGTNFHLLYGDMNDASSLNRILKKVRPNEIYNLAAQSHVGISFDIPEYTAEITGVGTVRLLDALRDTGIEARFYQASSSELYGKVRQTPQKETTPFWPRSPYGCAKAYAFYITRNYREAYGMFACNGILFNHESPRRGENFVSRKITLGLARMKYGLQECLVLGNLEAKRDWGYAPDYEEAMWLMLSHNKPDDYVIATGQANSVKEFVAAAARHVDLKLEWIGSGLEEKAYDKKTKKLVVRVSPQYFRPTEVDLLIGDSTKARQELNWRPRVSFEELVTIMMESDIKQAEMEAYVGGPYNHLDTVGSLRTTVKGGR